MKNKRSKIISALLAGALCLSALAGCGNGGGESSTASKGGDDKSSGTSSSSKEPMDVTKMEDEIEVSVAIMNGFTQKDSQIQKELEERYNVKFKLELLPGYADGASRITTMMTDVNSLPNVMWWWGMQTEFVQWAKGGAFVDVSEYMNRYTNIRDYYNKMDPKTLFYASEADGSIYRIPGDVAEPSCEVLWIRQDWLDNLKLKTPTTIDELEDVMRAFTEDDPDGNGKQDTYGLGGQGNDFRTFWPWIQSNDYAHYDRFTVDKDGKVNYGPMTEGTRKMLEEVAALYKKGYINPNVSQQGVESDEELARGGFGVMYRWVAYNNPSAAAMKSFYSTNPDAKWVPIDMVKGNNGNPQEDPATSAAWCYFALTKTAGDNAERIYAIWDDMAAGDTYVLRKYGHEGKEFEIKDGQYEKTITDDENNGNNIGLNLFADLFNRKDEYNISNTPETTALFNKSGEESRDIAKTFVEWKNVADLETWVNIQGDVTTEKDKYMWGVVTGTTDTSDTNWNAYLDNLNGLGMTEALAEAQEVYDKQSEQLDKYLEEGTLGCKEDIPEDDTISKLLGGEASKIDTNKDKE